MRRECGWQYVNRCAPEAQDNLGNGASTAGRAGERDGASSRGGLRPFATRLTEWTRERVPLQWAATQNNLGNAVQTLGERESGTAHLEEAVSAYREALTERTRDARAAEMGHEAE